MSNYKEFEGKTLDNAIRQACDYFGVAREKLEIDIVNDAKSGIFGLVGAKKACIRAARVRLGEEVSSLPAVPEADASGSSDSAHPAAFAANKASGKDGGRSAAKPARENKERGQRSLGAQAPENDKARPAQPPPRQEKTATPSGGESCQDKAAPETPGKPRAQRGAAPQPGRRKSADKPAPAAPGGTKAPESGTLSADIHPREELPDFVLEGCDEALLLSVVHDTVSRLINPIVGEAPCSSEITGNRVRITVDCGDASALLVGREGQTLASIQYLASRIIAKRIGGALRLQIDAGNYRERQDGKLKELALALAQKAKATGKAQSTRPLSAYQRRVIHLALEADDGVYTYSKGDGPQRRVMIQQQGNGPRPDSRHEPAALPFRDASPHIEDALSGGEDIEARDPGGREETGPVSG